MIGKENEKLVVQSKLNPIKNTMVVESDVIRAKDSTKIGEIADENGTLHINLP